MRRSTSGTLLVLAAVAALVLGTAPPAGAAASHQQIVGDGSSWSANAVNQWISDVNAKSLQVVYTAPGSAQGRKDFGYKTTDFAVSDIGFQGTDPLTGASDSAQGRLYAYLPIVAGGTSFPYQIRVGGQLVRNLRLSGETLAKIFTNVITNWNDKQITRDNNGHALPSIPIIPIVHSEGSGSTAQFTAYLARQYPSLWTSFSGADVMTEYFPRKGQQISQNGSDGVMNYLTSSAANGAIGYDEYSYPLLDKYPVAKVENSAGYFTLPDQYNVAVALTRAQIDTNPSSATYLLQKLDSVYVYTDPRTYPLSSYSYMIIPTGPNTGPTKDPRMNTARRQTLADFLYYSICQGQREMGPIGYSPLPINLVQAGFAQIGKLKQADAGVDLTQRDVTTCGNPTFDRTRPGRNLLAEIAPLPPVCDKAGQGPCTTGGAISATGGGSRAGAGAPRPTASGSAGPAKGGVVDPDTGQVVGDDTGVGGTAVGAPSDLAAYRSRGFVRYLAPVTALELLAVLVLPVVLYRRFGRRGQRS
jgi:ABC-type phosphate transport system substrate-binding protein